MNKLSINLINLHIIVFMVRNVRPYLHKDVLTARGLISLLNNVKVLITPVGHYVFTIIAVKPQVISGENPIGL